MIRFGISDKLSFVMLAWTCAFLLPWEYNILFVGLVTASAFTLDPFKPATRQSKKYLNRFLSFALVFTVVLILVNGILVREGPVRLNLFVVTFYDAGIRYGLMVSVRLVLLSISILVFFASIHFEEFVKYTESLGLPRPIISIILLTVFFLEQLPHRISQIFTAQEARGAPVREGIIARARAFFLILSPLVLSSLVESVERGLALELRGFNQPVTKIVLPQKRSEDGIWRYVFLSISLIIIILSIVHWVLK